MRPSEVLLEINTMVEGLDSDGVWDKITEFYLLCAHTFPAITVKLKGTGSLTNNGPFVAGDYLATGSGAGLEKPVGQPTKFLGTGVTATDMSLNPATNMSMAIYLAEYTNGGAFLSNAAGSSEQVSFIFDRARLPFSAGGTLNGFGTSPGFRVASRVSNTDMRFYLNGSQARLTTTAATYTEPGVQFGLFSHGDNTAVETPACKMSMAMLGSGLTASEVANLTTRIETFMDAIGAGVIA